MSRNYSYIKLNNCYFCLQQNLAVLAWILFLRRDDLHAIYTPWIKKDIHHGMMPYIKHWYRIFLSNLNILAVFSLYKFKLRDSDLIIELPFFGHLCKQVHKGYKVINLIKEMVIKVFDADVKRDSIDSEIERLRAAAQIGFAPALVKGNAEEGWYEEEFISGSAPLFYKTEDSLALLTSFKSEIIPCLNGLMLYKQPKTVYSLDYVNNLLRFFEVSRLSMNKSDIAEAVHIGEFVSSMVERILGEGSQEMYLVYSHGDFNPANMLSTKKGIRILDWESASYRSALFDFYSYFFYRSACIHLPLDNMINEMKQALPLFISEISIKLSDYPESISTKESIYRWTFYIEFMCRLVERERTDHNLNILDFIFRYMEAFNRYEEIIAGHAEASRRKTNVNNNPSTFINNIRFSRFYKGLSYGLDKHNHL